MQRTHRLLVVGALTGFVAVAALELAGVEYAEGRAVDSRLHSVRLHSVSESVASESPRGREPEDPSRVDESDDAKEATRTGDRSREANARLAFDSRANAPPGERARREPTLSGGMPATKTEREPAEPLAILDPFDPAPGALSLAMTGTDLGAPRRLRLWRIDGHSKTHIAETTSRDDGRFDFGQILMPLHEHRLVVLPAERMPSESDRARAVGLRARPPLPSLLAIEASGEDGRSFVLEVRTPLPEGRLLVATEYETLLASFDVSSPDAGAAQPVAILLESDEDFALLAHELPDGRSSDWRVVDLRPARSLAR